MATYNTSEDVKKSMRMLFLCETASGTYQPIAYSTSDGLSFSKDNIDTSNKMDGDWASNLGGVKSAELSNEAFCAYKDGITGEVALFTAFNEDKALFFKYAYANVTYDEDGLATEIEIDNTKVMYTGMMKISSLELTSDNGDVCKYSVSGASQGAVKQVSASA